MPYLTRRLASVAHALRGIGVLLRTQANARIHALATLLVVVAGCYSRLSLQDWALLAIAVSSVWMAEALNTAIELVVDLVSPQRQPLAARAKDVAAAAVLLTSLGAVVVGLLVFLPHWY